MSILLSSSLESFLQLIGVLLIFVFVLFITYITTRWLGGYTRAHSHNKNLKIIETINMGNNKMISIVQAGTKYLVVSVGKDDIHFLAELTEEELSELPDFSENTAGQESFQQIFEKLKAKLPKK